MSRPVSVGDLISLDFPRTPFCDDDPGAGPCLGCGVEIRSRRARVGSKWYRPDLCRDCRAANEDALTHAERAERERRQAQARLARCGLPASFSDLRLANQVFQDDGEALGPFCRRCNNRVVGVTRWNAAVIEAFEHFAPSRQSIYLMGPVGSGKTYLGVALAAERALGGMEVLYRSEAGLLAGERRHVEDRSLPSDTQRACEVALIVLDDFGGSDRMTDWAFDQIETIISQRYDAVLPVVITSNLPFSMISSRYGERIHSRLCEMVTREGLLELGGPDWRATRMEGPTRRALGLARSEP